MENLSAYAPPFAAPPWSEKDRWHLETSVTNIDHSVYAPLVFFPELIGALCSRASRAAEDLRVIFLREFIYPFLDPVRDAEDSDADWVEKQRYAQGMREFLEFLHRFSLIELFQNPKARQFYLTWLAQYGDDSIAQMAGCHLVFCGISQVAIKHFEDQRIGLAPIEKSTRYVNYAEKISGRYLYFTDPKLHGMRLQGRYRQVMDGLFDAYAGLLPRMQAWLRERFPSEKQSVIRAKSYDVLRGLLPSATLSQVAFFGNGQAFEYMMSRSSAHPLGEVRWAASRGQEELEKVIPAFLRRLHGETSEEYQRYLAERGKRVAPCAKESLGNAGSQKTHESVSAVRLLEYDPEGENKVITGMLFSETHRSWDDILARVRQMPQEEKRRILAAYLGGRSARWQKVGRAFENAYVRFEIVMNLGAYRDLHRHRMLTQQRQRFSCHHGYDIPQEVVEAGLEVPYRAPLEALEAFFARIERRDPDIAQYATSLAHRIRFQQWENLREFFWEGELRTIPEGHPDYRRIEQEKFRLLQKVYPLVCEFMLVNMHQYDFARRGQDERIAKKEKELEEFDR